MDTPAGLGSRANRESPLCRWCAVLLRSRVWVSLCFGAFASACLVDTSKVCGDNFVEAKDGTCVCPEDQVVKAGKCAKADKPNKPAPSKDDETTSDQGADEDDEADDGPPSTASDAAAANQDGAASNDAGPVTEPTEAVPKCTSSTECAEGELCDVHDRGQCQPAPEGLGSDCSSADDCAGTEATYCELFSTRTCQIEGCKELDGVCPGDMVCCEYAVLSNSLCVTADSLMDGECPAPGTRVERGEP